jgi:tRNA modification GTPase
LTGKTVISVINKIDLFENKIIPDSWVGLSAKLGTGIEELKTKLLEQIENKKTSNVLVTNLRHYDLLTKTNEALIEVLQGLDVNITGDFLAQDIRLALHHLGELTGTITNDDLLINIFSKFCIGK